MQVLVDHISDLERSLTVSVPRADLEPKIQQKLLATAQKARIKGFRPGKVPLKEVQRRYGQSIRFDVISEVIDERYRQAIKDQDLKPVGMPNIELLQSEEGQDLQFKAKFEVLPIIRLDNIGQAKVELPEVVIDQSDIDAVIQKMREERSQWVDAGDIVAENGMMVVIDYVGTLNGKTFEGGSDTNFGMELGSGQMIPGFEEQLLGVRAGDKKELQVTIAEDFEMSELAGKSVNYSVQVHKIQQRLLPELDAQLFKTLGLESGNLDDFVAMVSKNMQRLLADRLEFQRKLAMLEGLLAVIDINVPQALIEDELVLQRKRFQERFQQYSGGKGLSDDVMKNMFTDQDSRDKAIKHIRCGLLLSELAQKENIQVSTDEIEAKARDMAVGYENPEAVFAYYMSDKREYQQIVWLVKESLIVEKMLSQVQVSMKPLRYLELMKLG